MKIGLIDIDSNIPNLALMKLSAWVKAKGHEAELTSPLFAKQYDEIWASKVFDFTEMPNLPENAVVGGSGINLDTHLPFEDADFMPDYDLYNCKYAMGFTSRGCNRNCPWCIVPQKEGKWYPIAEIYDFWDGQDRIKLLDGSLNSNNYHCGFILNQLIKENIKTDFSQGLDIRYLTDKQAYLLSKVKLWKQIHFAWDLMPIEKDVRKGIEILGKYNLKPRSMFYVLIGFNSTPEEDLYRVETLRGLGVDPFVMPYDKFDDYQRRFARWVNHKAIFKSVKWKDYDGNIKGVGIAQ